ncbi:Dynein regulatory complex subunit 7 (Coiled-coil domain-containing protein 135) (Coiled-coil domain-containing protein lobo homolog) (Spermatogenesis-related gene in late stages of spermatogenesis cells protein), partial [Durusdinium trenchii]
MPPSQSKFIRDYYDSCETFCTLRDPLERFWSAFQNWSPTCDPLGIEAEAVELLKELKQRPYQRDCFFVPQVEMVYGTRRISNGMHQYCDRFLHQENLSAEFHELMVERGRPEVELPDAKLLSNWSRCSIKARQLTHNTQNAVYEYYRADYEAFGGGAPDSEERRAEHTAQILDLPSPWSERPDIPREKFHARCYQGEKTIFYHKCKVEQYAPYTQDDGLVQRMTLYKDVRRQIPLEIRERFKHRKDKLIERKRRPMQNETIERFLPGRPSTSATNAGGALKEFREISALSRELIFYKSRLDGLVRSVEIIGRKMFEYFEDRDDRLIYHSVTLDPSSLTSGTLRTGTKSKDTYNVESVGDVPIKKMTEKFRRNPEVPADEDIAKISFYLTEQSSASIYSSTGKIRVDYHRDPGSLTFRQCMYHYEDGNLRRRPASLPQPTQAEVHKLLQMQSTCRDRIGSSATSIGQE